MDAYGGKLRNLARTTPLAPLAFAAVVALAAPHVAAAAPAGKPQVKILTTSQTKILRSGGIVVRVTPNGPARLSARPHSRTFDSRSFRKLGLKRRVRLANQPKKLKLRLGREGRRKIASCAARRIRLRVGQRRTEFNLKRTTPPCRPRPIDLSRADECDFIGTQDDSLCMLPFPDDFYTVADPSAATGRRVEFDDDAMPRNAGNEPIDAAPYNLNDGFSPGQTIVARVPGLDNQAALTATDPIPINELSRNEGDGRGEPILVINARTGEHHPIWAEIDSNAEGEEAETALLIHGARNFDSGERYIVVLRNLKRADGSRIPAPEGFRYYRDRLPSGAGPINAQRPRFERIFKALRRAGIRRSNLHLAWDFTVATDENIAERVLHMRDDAFAQLGDTDLADLQIDGDAPQFAVTSVTDSPADPEMARRVQGTFEVPCYLTHPASPAEGECAPGSRFALGPDGLPSQTDTWTAPFNCMIPHAALDDPGAEPGRAQLYGHGLLGTNSQATSQDQQILGQAHNFVICATDEIGMSTSDVPNIAGNILTDMGNFPELADRLQQGMLNSLFLGRLMIHPDGLVSDAAFHVDTGDVNSDPVLDTSRLYFNGNSQGGIFGGGLTAIAPDFTRSVLGVPGMNYSKLLNRSVDFDTYKLILDPNYPSPLQQQLLLSMVQMLWDRGEPNGYAHRMTDDPLAETPAHEVLLAVAFGDHQVSHYTTDIEARTIGASVHEPLWYDGRWNVMEPAWGTPRIGSYPFADSALVYWDSGPLRPDPGNPAEEIGTDPPPLENIPNRTGEDPHGDPRVDPAQMQMVSDFLQPDAQSHITDTCAGPCYAGGFTGP